MLPEKDSTSIKRSARGIYSSFRPAKVQDFVKNADTCWRIRDSMGDFTSSVEKKQTWVIGALCPLLTQKRKTMKNLFLDDH